MRSGKPEGGGFEDLHEEWSGRAWWGGEIEMPRGRVGFKKA